MAREKLVKAYLDNIAQYLSAMTNTPLEETRKFAKNIIDTKMISPTVTNVITKSYGNTEVQTEELWRFIYKHLDDVIVPSGSVYQASETKRSAICHMAMDKLKERKTLKKKKLEAKGKGEDALAKQFDYAQASVKINLNSLPGGFGSNYNIFYDKGGYNAITSLARSLIAHAYTVTEQLIGGNFVWYNENELINHLIINSKTCPSKEVIEGKVKEFGLNTPSKEVLFLFYLRTIQNYDPTAKLEHVQVLLNTLEQHQITYLFYFGNLRTLLWGNENVFKPLIKQCMDLINDPSIDENVKAEDLFKIDGDLMACVTLIFNPYLKGLQVYDLPKKNIELARRFVTVASRIKKHMDRFEQLFEVFIYYPTDIPRINSMKGMWRNTVIISDTDSVIFTAKDWVNWYTGDIVRVTPETYHITGLVIYWVTKAITKVLRKFSKQYGAKGEFVCRLEMKNEYLYTVVIQYDIKKTYAAIAAIQEGVVLPKPQIDIKGGNLRSSTICEETSKFVKDFIVEDILKYAENHKLSAIELIQKVIVFETKIRKSLAAGEHTFLSMTAINNKDDYADPLVTAYFYYLAWQEIFADVYGDIRIPTKCPGVNILPPTNAYLLDLENKNKVVYTRIVKFKEQYKKFPPLFPLNPDSPVIPKELLPIVNVRHIIYTNMRPVYITLEMLGVKTGLEDHKLIFSDLYPHLIAQ